MTARYSVISAFGLLECGYLSNGLNHAMKRTLFALILLLLAFPGFSQLSLSPAAQISAITCGPSQSQLYTAFGHSAFRVYDSAQNLDVVFNYGIFDFDQPYFYLNFTRGYLYYKVAAYDYRDFQYGYLVENRFIHEQVLNLTPDQNQKLFDFLRNNIQPGNEKYRYDYFYNNCATKIRDVVIEVFGDSVRFDYSHIKTNYSIRELTDLYIEKQQPWGDLGIDICLGLPMDKKASPSEYMFLPDYIESCFDHAYIKRDGAEVPLVKSKIDEKALIHTEWEPEQSTFYVHPQTVMLIFVGICILITLFDLKRNKLTNLFDLMTLVVTGLLGVLLTILWLFTDHAAAARNFNLIWAFPVNLVAAFLLRRNSPIIRNYFLFLGIVLTLTLILFKVIPQDIHYALIPMIVGLAVRAFTQYWIRRKNTV
jgi:Domain of unknown function (DUF4105)